ncbi:MAG: zinc-binding dehydrogenase, partial [Hyphomicrobiaceae bacterium]|nr:zinc-binding dehydrogenase [Hyphomicrobiaceae bacterium]
RIFGSFGCTLANMRAVMDKMARGEVSPVVDSTLTLKDIETGLERLESRDVFGKIVLTL